MIKQILLLWVHLNSRYLIRDYQEQTDLICTSLITNWDCCIWLRLALKPQLTRKPLKKD